MKIVLLSTGGTIAASQDPQTGLVVAGKKSGEELIETLKLKEKQPDVELKVDSVFQIQSSAMSFNHCCELIAKMEEYLRTENAEAFIISHGTDTLEETSYTLSLLWNHDIPVILTGAQIAPDEKGSDAYNNLYGSIVLAKQAATKSYRVILYFNEQFFDPRFVKKLHTSNINGFGSYSGGSLGLVDGDNVFYYSRPVRRAVYPLPKMMGLNEKIKVALIREHMDMCEELYQAIKQSGIKGLIIEGFGRGHVSPQSADEVLALLEDKRIVLLASTCDQGSVKEIYNFKGSIANLINFGAINAHTYSPKKARIKLQILLTLRKNEDSFLAKLSENEFHDFLVAAFAD